MTTVIQISNYGYISYVLNLVLLTKYLDKICLFMFLLPLILFPKNIQRKFTLILLFKKIEMKIAVTNHVRIYKLNFS